ncbi:MAG TPA: DUF4097 family beta strand repeat-containing protein [Vicinamibacterales bacterium]|nr:DUF4097 family beta strand repeat-containing protein [Vicinamibacterales bacterium]
MKHPTITHLILAFAVALLPATALAQKQTESVDKNLPFPSGGTLKLNNFSGDVRITGGSGRNFVMKATRRGYPDVLREMQLTIESSGSTITVDANHRDRDSQRWNDNDRRDNMVETTFEIEVPAGARLDINVFSSDVTISGVDGDQRLKTFSGNIDVRDARGMINANSFSGEIDVDATGQGTSPDLDMETFSGSMRVRLADRARGNIEFNTFSGSFDAAYPVTLRTTTGRRNIRAELPGGSGSSLRFKSFSGELRLVR